MVRVGALGLNMTKLEKLDKQCLQGLSLQTITFAKVVHDVVSNYFRLIANFGLSLVPILI